MTTPAYTPKNYRYWQQSGYTTIRPDDGSAESMTFRGTTPQELAEHIQSHADRIAREKRYIKALAATLKAIDPAYAETAMTYTSPDNARLDPTAG